MYAKDPDGESPMYLITFARYQGGTLRYLPRTYFYAPDGEFRFRIDDFMTDYTAVYDTAEKELRFYYPDVPEVSVLTVRYVSLTPAEHEIFIEIPEPAVSKFTEEQIKRYVEFL